MPLDDNADRLAEAQRLSQDSQRLASISSALSARLDKPGVIEVACNAARQLTEADGACVILREGDLVYYSQEDAIAPLWAGQRFPIDNCIGGWSILHRAPVVIEDVHSDSRIPLDYYRNTFVKALAIMPMQPENPFGAIGVYWSRRHRADERQLKLLETLANLASTAIAHAELFEEAKAARAEAERHADALQKQADLIDQSSDALLIWEIEGGITFWNRGAEQLYGFTREEALGRVSHELLQTDHGMSRQEFERLLKQQLEWQGELHHTTKDGHRITVESRCKVAGQNGRTYVMESNRDVTERSRIVEALRESEERFSKAFDASPLSLTITSLKTGRLMEVNDTFMRVTGYTRDEAVGRTTLELGLWANPEDRAVELAIVSGEGLVRRMKFRFRMKDGSEVIGLLSAERLEIGGAPCALTVIEDITDRERAEAWLLENEERLRLALEAGQVGTWDWDIASNHVTWSETIYHFHGLKPGEFSGRVEDFAALVHPDDRERVNVAIQAAVESRQTYSAEMRVVWPDGTVRWIATNGKALYNAEGQPIRMLGATVDITDRKLAEESLIEADRRKDEFLAMLAHELRNPLAPIRNAAQLLRRLGPPVPELQWARDVIDRQIGHLGRLVDDLLDVSRITEGKVTLRKETVDLVAVIGSALEASRPLIEERNHQLSVALPEHPLRVEGDPTRLTQVVSNLLNNAAKFTPEGGHIWLSAEAVDNQVVLRVRDTGAGIAADLLPHVFDLFRQADRSLDRSQGGLGVGLTLVRRLLELHGGSVEAFSEGPERGSEFVVRLPSLARQIEVGRAASVIQSDELAAAPCRILVVDDNVDSAESIALLLELNGHQVRMAHDGPTALEVAGSFRPEVIVLDIGLPGMDGYEVARRLRNDSAIREALLIALTGYGQDEDRQQSLAAGFDHHLVKPIDTDTLQDLIASQRPSTAERSEPAK
ncbi:MAG: PAS domain S-box protein [Blastocatellia bacterium]